MAKFTEEITPFFAEFISAQKMFFTATAAPEGRINLSPKGLDSLKVITPKQVAWLNMTGSGNETAAHLLKDNRITVMFNSYDEKPLILRLYGTARSVHERDEEWDSLLENFPTRAGSRQVIVMDIESVQTSCGWGVPLMNYVGERNQLEEWAAKKSDEKVKEYWSEKNAQSIDGLPTGIFEDPQ